MLIYYVHKLLEENKTINKQNHLLQNIQNLTHNMFIELIKCHLLNFQLFQFLYDLGHSWTIMIIWFETPLDKRGHRRP